MRGRIRRECLIRALVSLAAAVLTESFAKPTSVADVVRVDEGSPLQQDNGKARRNNYVVPWKELDDDAPLDASAEASSRSLLHQSVVGGTLTDGQEFPFFVEGNGCAGSLVAPDVVLAAGHCAPVRRSVLVGSYVYDDTVNHTAQARRTILGRSVVHPNFSTDTARYDYMLYSIESVTLPNLKTIELNVNNNVPVPGENVTVIGYGLTSDNFTTTNRIQKASVPAMNTTICHDVWASSGNSRVDDGTMLCTAGSNPPKGPCLGDSGGPLFDANLRQVGIVSWGAFPGCGVKPAVYSRVSTAIQWIRRTMCQLTTNASALSFRCPDLVCPIDTTIIGSPVAILPRVGSIDTFHLWNGFRAVRLLQVPPAGTKIPPNTVQIVRVYATNSSNRTALCRWKVTVPPTRTVASFVFNVSRSVLQDPKILSFPNDVSGNVFRIKASLANATVRLRGSPTAYLMAVLDNNDTPIQSVVVLRKNETTRIVNLVTPVPITTDWKVTLRAVGVTNIKNVTVVMQLLGQMAVAP